MPGMNVLGADLAAIVDEAVRAVIQPRGRDEEAAKQHALQTDLQQRLDQSAPSGDRKADGLGREADDDDDPLDTGAPKRAVGQAPTGAAQSQVGQQPPSTPQAQPVGEVDADAIIDKFNIIRSGRSLNDRDISDMMKQYLGSLSVGQRGAVFGILQRIGQIVAPTVDTQRLHAPPEEPSAVQAARLKMLQKHRETGQPTQDSAPEPRAAAPAPREPERDDKEDTSPPIRVGSRTSEGARRRTRSAFQE